MMTLPIRKNLQEVCQICGVSSRTIETFIAEKWIVPIDAQSPMLDEEDIARINLILELQRDFEVNDQAMDIVLHLIDRIQVLNLRLKKSGT